MSKFLAKCVKDTTIQGIKVGDTYCIEHEIDFKVIYNETETTFEPVFGNKDWFYEHFEPVRCISCADRNYCRTYDDGREYSCYGFEEEKS